MGRLVKIESEREGLRLLVERLRIERDELRVQRDDAIESARLRQVKLYEWERREEDLRAWAEHRSSMEDGVWGGRILWGVGGVGVGVVVGVIAVVLGGG